MFRKCIVAMCCYVCLTLFATEPPVEPVVETPPETPVEKGPEPAPAPLPSPAFSLHDSLHAAIITDTDIRDTLARTLPEALLGIPGFFIRESGAGIQTPLLNGRTTGAIPVFLDGIPLGEELFTGGAGAWLSLIDRRMARRVIVTRAPDVVAASVAAAGGAIYIDPHDPSRFRPEKDFAATGRFNTRFSSADTGRDAHARVTIGYDDFGATAGGSILFSDARHDGAQRAAPYSAYEHYGAHFNGEWNFGGDLAGWRVSTGYLFAGMENAADTTGLFRADRTIELYDRAAHLAWGRLLMDFPNSAIQGALTLFYQHQSEDRERGAAANPGGFLRLMARDEFAAHTVGAMVDFTAGIIPERLILRYGALYLRDMIGAAHFEKSDPAAALTRGGISPLADESSRDRFAGYLSAQYALLSDAKPHALDLSAGYRFEGSAVRAPARDDLPAIRYTHPGHGAEAGLTYRWRENFGAALTYGHGTRIPALRESSYCGIHEGLLLLPNDRINPETTDTLALQLRGKSKHLQGSIGGFATHIGDRIALTAVPFGGRAVRYDNVGRALIWGITAEERLTIPFGLSISGAATYQWGEEKLKNDAIVPVDHIPPLLWNIALRWDAPAGDYGGFAELVVRGATGARTVAGDDPYRIDRLPWQSVTVRGGVLFDEYIRVLLSIENLFDKEFRYYRAGLNAPGIGGVLSLDAEF